MLFEIEEYLEKLNARAIDPDEFVEQSGNLIRTARRKESKQKYRAKNREEEVANSAKWREKNPDKLRAQ
jgi:hypothetical protein